MGSFFVEVGQDKECRMCGQKIAKGTRCFEVDWENEDTFWICQQCVDIENEIAVTESNIESSYWDKKIMENIKKLMKSETEQGGEKNEK